MTIKHVHSALLMERFTTPGENCSPRGASRRPALGDGVTEPTKQPDLEGVAAARSAATGRKAARQREGVLAMAKLLRGDLDTSAARWEAATKKERPE